MAAATRRWLRPVRLPRHKNFVDHDPRFPGFVQDYTCGSRTYDLGSGYNHAGTDYELWAFPWLMMDQGMVRVVAVAPGVIAAKTDGNFDRNCAIASATNPNFVRVLQDDGLSAIYLHMRNGEVTNFSIRRPDASTFAQRDFDWPARMSPRRSIPALDLPELCIAR